MEAHSFFLHVLIILLSARFLGEIARPYGVPSVIGELLAGVILGPSLLGFIPLTDILHLLAEVGLILLLFEMGLETDVGYLVRAGKKAMVVAVGGFVLPLILGFAVSYGVLYEFAHAGEVDLINAGKVLMFVTLFFLLAPIVAKGLGSLIRRYHAVSEMPGLLPTMIISLVLFFGWLAHVFGAPEILGGFAAGVALSRRFFLPFGLSLSRDEEFSDKLAREIRPIVYLFTPVFFVYVDLALDLSVIDWGSVTIWVFGLSLLLIAFVGKFGGAMVLRLPWLERIGVGVAMAPRGEAGLIFAELGRAAGVFTNEIHAALIIVIAMTTMLSLFLMKWHHRKHEHVYRSPLVQVNLVASHEAGCNGRLPVLR